MHDYRVLYGDRISNGEFRKFCGIGNIQTANKMLKKLFETKIGANKGSLYIIPSTINDRASIKNKK